MKAVLKKQLDERKSIQDFVEESMKYLEEKEILWDGALATRSSRNPQPISNTIPVQMKKQEKHPENPVNPVWKKECQDIPDVPHSTKEFTKNES